MSKEKLGKEKLGKEKLGKEKLGWSLGMRLICVTRVIIVLEYV